MLPLKREDYKTIKHMDKSTMERYLNGIYLRGYSDGATDMAPEQKAGYDKALVQQSEVSPKPTLLLLNKETDGQLTERS